VPEAVAELNRRAGSQFDPAVLAALERGLARQRWEPTHLEPGVLATSGRWFDHDDPGSFERMVGPTAREQITPALLGAGAVAAGDDIATANATSVRTSGVNASGAKTVGEKPSA